MTSLVVTAAVLALAASGMQAPRGIIDLTCTGGSRSEAYPYGSRDSGEMRYRVTVGGQQLSVIQLGVEDGSFCMAGAACAVTATDGVIRLQVSRIPHADPLYSANFELDRTRLTFTARGGGLDGGWSVAGTCRTEHP